MQELTEKQFIEKVTQNRESCVVLFSKNGCPICQQVEPLLNELEEKYQAQSVPFYRIDTLAEAALMKRMSLKGVPQVLFFYQGESRGKYTGIRNIEEYQEKIEEVLHG